MPSFRDKLERLEADRQARGAESRDGGGQPSPHARSPAEPQAGRSAETQLEALRQKLGAMIGAHGPGSGGEAAAREPAIGAKAATQLPFEQITTPEGPCWAQRTRIGTGSTLGSVSLDALLDADFDVVSLLSLTPALAHQLPRGALFLDTETTGLAGGGGSVAFLVGLAWYQPEDRSWQVEQLLLRELHQEAALLVRVREHVQRAAWLVTYNGKSFDLPLLGSRYVMNQLAALPERPHLDLLHLVRRVHKSRPWKKSLTSAEVQVLGYDRGPDVAGEDVAKRYLHYLRSGDEEGLAAVIEHNLDDVRSMVALAGLYGEPCLHLEGLDLAQAARVMKSAGDLGQAHELAELAVQRGVGPPALRARAEVAKARGDRAQALSDFETLAQQVDDDAVRLELAKLYEHFARKPTRALAEVRRGTGELPDATARRRDRLERKIEVTEQEPTLPFEEA